MTALVPLVACTREPEPPPPPDPLTDLAAQARQDAAAATAIAAAAPALAPAATEIAQARTEHATALQAEVDRLRPPASSSASSSAVPSSTSPPPPAGDPVAALATMLEAAQNQAAELVPSLPRYRAGLVGSVSAGCASLRVVLT